MNGEELKTIFLENPNDERLQDVENVKKLLVYQFWEDTVEDDVTVMIHVCKVLTYKADGTIDSITDKFKTIATEIRVNEKLKELEKNSMYIYDRVDTALKAAIAEELRYKPRGFIFRVAKRAGIVAAMIIFTVLVLPAPSNKQNAHDKNIVSYVINSIRQKLVYSDNGEGSLSSTPNEFSTFELGWMFDGFKSYGATIEYEDDYILMTHIYRNSNQYVTYRIQTFKESGYTNYDEIDGDITEKTINGIVYNFSTNYECNQVIWDHDNKFYTLYGNIDMNLIEELVTNNFGGR